MGGGVALVATLSCCALGLLNSDCKDATDSLLEPKDCFGCKYKQRLHRDYFFYVSLHLHFDCTKQKTNIKRETDGD